MASSVKNTINSWRNQSDGERNPATNQYKGLVSFIADLRAARARELEEKRINRELANIRQKFKEGKLTSYDKKKYVCKLLYIYILGWNLDFGHLEAVNLISGNKFSEKQIGYLAVTLFFHEQHELLHLVVNSISKDLRDHNELNNCLALHAIANVGGRAMADALGSDVYRLLIAPTSNYFVKKKAALTLLRLYRKQTTVVQRNWAERIISLMDDPNLGVALSVTSLVLALAQDEPDSYKASYTKSASRLKQIMVDRNFPMDYMYYNVPCPWLQVKLLRILQSYPPSEDTYIRDLIRSSLQRIMDAAMDMQKNVQQNNAQNAVLFEAIKLIIHLDTEEELMIQISSRLGKFIVARETNVRYLGLEAMTHLASRGETLNPIKKHQTSIVASLRDRDITVRRQALDLLYCMCDNSNAQSVVSELLKHLQIADYAIREEMVLKIAILAEKHATDAQWYVDTSLRLLSMAGDHVSDEVWQRVIQIVTNNEGLQDYAARNILRYIKAEQCHESLARIGGYVLGEFGHLIADSEGCSPIEQFLALQNKLYNCSSSTKAIILSAFIKFVNLFPEIKTQLLDAFQPFSDGLDSELQQRACEYLALAKMPTDDLLRTVFDEMPPFPERASALLSRIHMKSGKRTNTPHASADRPHAGQPSSRISSRNMEGGAVSSAASGSVLNGTDDLHGLHLSTSLGLNALKSGSDNNAMSPERELDFHSLLLHAEGVLYEDDQMQIGVRSQYRGYTGAVVLYFQNKASFLIESFTTTIENPVQSSLRSDMKSLPDTNIHPRTQTQQQLVFEAKNAFDEAPYLRVSYLAGSHQAFNVKLPVALHKYMEPAVLGAEDFFKRWKQIGGAPREAQTIFGPLGTGSTFDADIIRSVIAGFQWGILDNVDPNAKNYVGATVLHTTEGGKFGCLMRLEPNFDTRLIRLTIRATSEAVPPALMKSMKAVLEKAF